MKVRARAIAAAVTGAVMMVPALGSAHDGGTQELMITSIKVAPVDAGNPFVTHPAPAGASGPQSGGSFSGNTPPTGSGFAGAFGIGDFGSYEFDVLSGYDNDMLVVSISWGHGDLDPIYDMDLYVDRKDDAGNWVQVGFGAGAQDILEGQEATETARVGEPLPGRYRARVYNYANLGTSYEGSIVFISNPEPGAGRALFDRADLNTLPKAHVIYFVPTDRPDESLDTNGTLSESVLSMNQWWGQQTGGRKMRLDNYLDNGVEKLDITFVRGLKTNAQYISAGMFGSITDELEARGFATDAARKRYIVMAATGNSSSACGTAYYTLGDGYAQWAVTFLNGPVGCRARQFGNTTSGPSYSETITAQELLHNEGLVPIPARHHCAGNQGHVCTGQALSQLGNLDPESYDVLFPYVGRPLWQKKIDIDHDDYYQHGLPYRDYKNTVFLE